MMMVQIISVVAVIVRVIPGALLVPAVMHSDKADPKAKITCIMSGVMGGIAVGTGMMALGAGDVIRIAAEVVIVTLLTAIYFHIEYRKCLFVAIFYEIAIALIQFLIGAGVGIALKDSVYIDTTSMLGQIAVGGSCLIAVVATIIAYRKREEGKSNIRLVIYAGVILFGGIISVGSQNRIEIPQEDVYMWVIFAACLLVGILVFNMSRQYEIEKKLAQMNAEQAELIEKEYTELNEVYATNAKLFHDFHNHIGMIRQLVTGEKYEEAVNYLDELQAPVRELTESKWTGDSTIDYLINTKMANASEHNTDMQVQVEYPRHSNLKSVDMCAIIGNLLDNALEAVSKVSEQDERFVRLTVRRINQMLVIKVENSFAAKLISENGQLKTTKKEGGIHGWGIKSVRAAVEKYEGSVQIVQENNVFKVVATLSFQGVEQKNS